MFTRLALRKTTGFAAHGLNSRVASQTRLSSKVAILGSKGRAMPALNRRATAAASGVDATFTIRVRLHTICIH